MNKTIKKIIALGAISAFAVAPVFATTLADYPAPFVNNGAFNGKIVIGSSGNAVADFLGVVDIAASLQRASSTAVSTGTTTTASIENGYKFAESHELVLGDNLYAVTAVVDDTDLPALLKSGTVTADDSTEYDYDLEINPVNSGTDDVSADINNNNLDDTYTKPVVYYDLGNDAMYDAVVDFTDSWSLAASATDDTGINSGSTSITLFGRDYVFDQTKYTGGDTLVLYGSDTTVLVAKGETQTITYGGKDYSVSVLGGNSDDSSAIVRVGSETKTLQEGDSKTVGGLPVYVKDVFVSNIGGDDVSVQLFIGSNKLELEWSATQAGEVKLNGKVLDEVTFDVEDDGVGNEWENVDKFTFRVTPKDATNEVEYILPGKEYVDPLFGSFKFSFVGAEDLMKGKEAFKVEQNGKKLNVVFTPKDGSETTLTLLEDNAVYDKFFNGATLTALEKDDTFIYTEFPADADKAITHVLQVSRVKDGNDRASTSYEIVIDDLTFDKTYTVTKCEALDNKIALYPELGTTADLFNLTADSDCVGTDKATETTIFTNAGAQVTFNQTNISLAADSADELNVTDGYLIVDEDAQDDADSSTKSNFVIQYTWDSTDDAYSVTKEASGTYDAGIGNDDNVEYYLSGFGTYVTEDIDSTPYKYVRMYVPAEEVVYDMFLAPVASKVTVTTTGTGGAVSVNPIAVGMAILDSDAKALGTTPYIVVGGPCVNSVAAGLLGNPADCTAGFMEGKAKIKFFADKNALLVAGYTAKDTQGASRVLAEYKTYKADLVGTEVEVVTTTLSDLKVNKVQ